MPDAAQRLRRTICSRLESLRASTAELYAAELVFGELAANAARFAPGAVDVALDSSTPLPVLHVLDGGNAFSARGTLPADELAERGRGLSTKALVRRIKRPKLLRPGPSKSSTGRVSSVTSKCMWQRAPCAQSSCGSDSYRKQV